MKGLRLSLLLMVAAVSILGGHQNATAAASDELPAAILHALETAGSTLPSASKPAEIEALRTYYLQREGQPSWVDETGISERGLALARAFLNAARDGLDAADYDLGPFLGQSGNA